MISFMTVWGKPEAIWWYAWWSVCADSSASHIGSIELYIPIPSSHKYNISQESLIIKAVPHKFQNTIFNKSPIIWRWRYVRHNTTLTTVIYTNLHIACSYHFWGHWGMGEQSWKGRQVRWSRSALGAFDNMYAMADNLRILEEFTGTNDYPSTRSLPPIIFGVR